MRAFRPLLCVALIALGDIAVATVEVAPFFGSHMVLQRDKPVVVWGTAKSDEVVNVKLGAAEAVTKANKNGQWKVEFAPLATSFDPITLRVGDIVFEDILVGDVWLTSGQSNMVFPLERTDGFDVEAIISNSRLRLMRLRNPRNVAIDGYTDEELARSNVDDFFRGEWEVSDADSAADFSAVAWIMGNMLSQRLDVPVGLVQVAVGGSAINNWLPPQLLKDHSHTSHLYRGDWLSNEKVHAPHRRRAREAFQNVLVDGAAWVPGKMPYRWMCEPGFLFESGIQPLANVAFRGVAWYQGETDAVQYHTASQYRDLLPLMIRAWRDNFGDVSLPFIVVQLPRHNVDSWPAFRHAQGEVAEQVSNVSLVVTIDTGFEDDVHPTDKGPIGKRMAIAALTDVYRSASQPRYPVLSRVRASGFEVNITLSETDLGERALELPGFEIGDQYGEFFPAGALVRGRDQIVIRSPVACPRFLRYGWTPYPKPDLEIFNDHGMPLAPFRVELDSCHR